MEELFNQKAKILVVKTTDGMINVWESGMWDECKINYEHGAKIMLEDKVVGFYSINKVIWIRTLSDTSSVKTLLK